MNKAGIRKETPRLRQEGLGVVGPGTDYSSTIYNYKL